MPIYCFKLFKILIYDIHVNIFYVYVYESIVIFIKKIFNNRNSFEVIINLIPKHT